MILHETFCLLQLHVSAANFSEESSNRKQTVCKLSQRKIPAPVCYLYHTGDRCLQSVWWQDDGVWTTPSKRYCTMRARRPAPHLNWILPSSGLLRGVMWFETDVSGLPICPILKGQGVQEEAWAAWPMKMGSLGCPATSVSNDLMPRSNTEDGRIQYCSRCTSQLQSYLKRWQSSS
jgi:hypothetical protein